MPPLDNKTIFALDFSLPHPSACGPPLPAPVWHGRPMEVTRTDDRLHVSIEVFAEVFARRCPPGRYGHFCGCLKYRKSGGGWFLRAGISMSSPLRK
jgi:hypothetical protein